MLLMVICIPVQAAEVSTPHITVDKSIEQLENGDYIETTIYVDAITVTIQNHPYSKMKSG